jgi:hypothetical protein
MPAFATADLNDQGDVMTRRPTALVALALGTAGLGAAVLMPATASATTRAPEHVLTLTARYADGNFHFVGKDAKHPQIGDEFLDDGPVRSNGRVVGRFADICTIIEGTSEATIVTQCVGTLRLAKGQIVTTGASGNSNDTTDAITGGTGAFAYVRGTAESVSGPNAVTMTYRYITAD